MHSNANCFQTADHVKAVTDDKLQWFGFPGDAWLGGSTARSLLVLGPDSEPGPVTAATAVVAEDDCGTDQLR